MAQNTSISLDQHFSDFLAKEVDSGRYRSASEVVRAGTAGSVIDTALSQFRSRCAHVG